MTPAIGYIRISRVNGRHGENYISPDVQRDRIEELARQHGLHLIDIVTDEDMSGGTNNRPSLQAALTRIEEREAHAIVVAYQSRFARSLSGTYESLARLDAVGAALYAGDNGGGKIERAVMTAVAEVELDRIAAQWADARSRLIARGGYAGHTAPLGYRFGEGKRLVVDEPVASAVRKMFEGRATGRGAAEVIDGFAEATGRRLHPGSLKRIIGNRAYIGESRSGAFVNASAHEPLVTLDLWEAAQSQRTRPARTTNGSLLGGVLRCASCEQPMSYRGGEGRQYACNRFANGQSCPGPVLIKADEVDSYVEGLFKARYFGKPKVEGVSTRLTDLAKAEAELDRATSDLRHTLRLDLSTLIDPDEVKAMLAEKQQAKQAAADRIRELRRARSLDERLVSLEDVWDSEPIEKRRAALGQAVAHVTVRRVGPGYRVPIQDRVEVVFAADVPDASAAPDLVAA